MVLKTIFPTLGVDYAIKVLRGAMEKFELGPFGNILPIVIEHIQRVAIIHVLEDHEIVGIKGTDIRTEAICTFDELLNRELREQFKAGGDDALSWGR